LVADEERDEDSTDEARGAEGTTDETRSYPNNSAIV
jgi:hypothetical protein